MSDDNPAAYKKAPGDHEAKTKLSKHTKRYRQMFGEDNVEIAKKRIEREKQMDKRKHDRMMDRARMRDVKKINKENRANDAVIINKGNNIEKWIEDFDKRLIDAGWCNVFHQSTEYLIIGMLTIPKIVIIDVILNALSSFS